MDNRSLEALLEETLKAARDEHHLQVILGNEKNGEWPAFYARFLVKRLGPVLATLQGTGVTLTVDGAAVPPFYSRTTQEEIGSQIASRLHVGE